jgi:hypothetical protein
VATKKLNPMKKVFSVNDNVCSFKLSDKTVLINSIKKKSKKKNNKAKKLTNKTHILKLESFTEFQPVLSITDIHALLLLSLSVAQISFKNHI